MKHFATNEALFKVFIDLNVTQVEFGHLTDTDKNSIHDWLKNKNQMKFDKLNECLNNLGLKAMIVISKI
jgi:hypothetical protein